MSTITATASDDDVFRAFALGDDLEGDTTRALTWHYVDTNQLGEEFAQVDTRFSTLYSHGVLLALRSEEVVVFDASPCKDGGRCTCRYMSDVGKARAAVQEHYGTAEVENFEHGAFVALAGRLGAL